MGEGCVLPVLDCVAPVVLFPRASGQEAAQKLLDPENIKRAIRTTGKEALQDKEKKGLFYT